MLDDGDRLLRALLDELEAPADIGAEQAWLDELRRRSRELDDGAEPEVRADPG